MRLFLCDVRRRKRSIVSLCEHFDDRHSRAKRTHQNDFQKTQKAVRNGTAFCISSKLEYIGASYYFIYSATWSTGTIASLKM